MIRAARPRRRWLAPEIVQTSGTDCGPAALACMLEGFGTRSSYARIREACQTQVDGTSIDRIEEILVRLGFDAEQTMLPVDHLLGASAGSLPAIVIVRLPTGFTHFVILWRMHGPFVQVMDPETGRRWIRRDALARELFVHTTQLPADTWREWARTDAFLHPLRERVRRLGVKDAGARIEKAVAQESWLALASLDACVRMTEQIAARGGVRRGAEASSLLDALSARASSHPTAIPERYWFARPCENPEEVSISGAVLIAVRGRSPDLASPSTSAGTDGTESLPKELVAALAEPPFRPWRLLARRVWDASGMRVVVVLAMIVLASFTTLLEALVMRGLIDLTRFVHAHQQRVAALFAVLVLFAAVFGLDWKLLDLVQRTGRALEADLRIAFLSKVPRLGVRYFRSRPTSDLAERIHGTHRVRALPELTAEVIRDVLGHLAILAGIAWVDPRSLLPATIVVAVSLVVPAAVQPAVRERELRMRTHAGAMLLAYMDALLGMMPLRAHVGGRALRREHEQIVAEWARSGMRLLRTTVTADAVVSTVRVACLAWILYDFLHRPEAQRSMLLVTYWALYLGTLSRRLVTGVRLLAPIRNITFRVLEPMGAPEDPSLGSGSEEAADVAPPSDPDGPESPVVGVRIDMQAVTLKAGGMAVLDDIELRIAPGEHVAIVGMSGGGKTSLVALLLGLYAPSSGTVRIDGMPMNALTRERLGPHTVWVDPSVHLWNASLLANLLYGATRRDGIADALASADLLDVVEHLPDGMQTPIGEGGRLLSGGQGQRVRLGRAATRSPVRFVVFDEAFRGLEIDRRRILLDRARHTWPRATFLCATHDVRDTLEFPRVLVVEHGRIVEDGAPQALMQRERSRYRALYEADAAARRELWDDPRWRRIDVRRGLVEEARRGP